MSSYYDIRVLVLLFMCPHTPIHVLIPCKCPHTTFRVLILPYMFPHTTICVRIPYACPRTTMYVSSHHIRVLIIVNTCADTCRWVYGYPYKRVLMLIYLCPHAPSNSLTCRDYQSSTTRPLEESPPIRTLHSVYYSVYLLY